MLAALLLPLLLPNPTVSVESLLPEMATFDHLTRRSTLNYAAAQASSFDRASAQPGGDPFANGDAGKFLRTEEREGRKEYVMADLTGPGAVVRIWSANPAGTLRLYIDGEETPRFAAKMRPLLTGLVEPFRTPFAYEAANGTNLYFPIPYAKSLKVTVDNTDNDAARALYYHVGYRTYPAGTTVKSFEPASLPSGAMSQVASRLTRPTLTAPNIQTLTANRTLALKGRLRVDLGATGGQIVTLAVRVTAPKGDFDWIDPRNPAQLMRRLILRGTFDGETTIEAPLGDFFGSAPGINPYTSLPFTVAADGTMLCRLPMPFRSRARIEIENTSSVRVPVELSALMSPRPWTSDSYTLHAQWTAERSRTRPFKDMSFLDVAGEGAWLGSMMHIANPVPDWWGEGDEKVYVDGESFPSTFGTGTEDYYGYAWSSPTLFQRPYHAQTRCDGPGTRGQVSVNRWHILDPIPFTKSLRFDMELWHWADVETTVARVAYWYAKPGSSRPVAIAPALLSPPEIAPVKPVKGAIEGEDLRVVSRTGGNLENQGGFWQLSGGQQSWWTQPKAGDTLTYELDVPSAGRYEVVGHFCFAPDYGIHQITLNGRALDPIDFFGSLEWKLVSLGTFDLPKGKVPLIVTCRGSRPEAKPGNMFGLDYLLLKK